ncbi:MAG: RHS repeat-associated core domain-containing protein, partial [Bacteroidota bacterium]
QYMDNLGRVVRSSTYAGSDSIASITGYTFLNQPFRSVAPKGDSTRYTYDFLGRLKQKNNADEGTSKYVYDKAGRLRFMVDAVGEAADPSIVLYWKYDNLGRVIEKGKLIGEEWGDGSAWQGYADSTSYYPAYSEAWRKKYYYGTSGRVDSVLTNSDDLDFAEVNERFSYDKFGNISEKNIKVVSYSSSTTYSTRYAYDLLGRSLQIDLPASKWEDVSVTYSYDQMGRVTKVGRLDGDPVANYTYGSSGQMATEVLNPSGGGGSKTRTFTYNPQGLITGISNSLYSESLSYSSGGYNNNEGFYHGLIASTTSSYYAGGPSSLTYSYQYDNFGRLIVADNTLSDMDIGVGSGNATTYDANGNIDSLKRGGGTKQAYNYYPGKNQVQNTDGSGNDYGYNETGSVTSTVSKSLSLSYDAFTQMTITETKSGVTTYFQYEANKERVYTERSGTKKVYLRGLEDYPIMTKSSNGVEQVFVYGPTGLIAMRDDETWYYVHKDHLGSTRLLSNGSGAAVTTYDFDAMGTQRRDSVNVSVPYQFTGQEFDEGVVLHNFRARMYDSDLGYFYAPDPAHQGFAPYGYVGGNPISFVDPTGRGREDSHDNWAYLSSLERGLDLWHERLYGSGGGVVAMGPDGNYVTGKEFGKSKGANEAEVHNMILRKVIAGLSATEILFLTAAVGGEGVTEKEMAQIAYAILNRLVFNYDNLNSLIAIIVEPEQIKGFFNSRGQYILTGVINDELLPAKKELASGTSRASLEVLYSDMKQDAMKAIEGVRTGSVANAIGNSMFFGNDPDLAGNQQPFVDARSFINNPSLAPTGWFYAHIDGTHFFTNTR